MHSDTDKYLDNPLKAIPEKAVLVPRGKLVQNRRTRCGTKKLIEGRPADVVAA